MTLIRSKWGEVAAAAQRLLRAKREGSSRRRRIFPHAHLHVIPTERSEGGISLL